MAKKPAVTKVKTHHPVEGEIVDKKPASARPGNTTVIQVPNKPLAIALTALVLAHFIHGPLGTVIHVVGIVALGYWAYLEINHGVNGIRRFMGWLGALLALNMAIHLLLY